MITLLYGATMMLHLLETLARAAPVGTPLNWRRVTWPTHDTVAIRTLFHQGLLEARGMCLVVVTPAGAAALHRERRDRWLARQEQWRTAAAERGLLLSGGDSVPRR